MTRVRIYEFSQLDRVFAEAINLEHVNQTQRDPAWPEAGGASTQGAELRRQGAAALLSGNGFPWWLADRARRACAGQEARRNASSPPVRAETEDEAESLWALAEVLVLGYGPIKPEDGEDEPAIYKLMRRALHEALAALAPAGTLPVPIWEGRPYCPACAGEMRSVGAPYAGEDPRLQPPAEGGAWPRGAGVWALECASCGEECASAGLRSQEEGVLQLEAALDDGLPPHAAFQASQLAELLRSSKVPELQRRGLRALLRARRALHSLAPLPLGERE